jgi:hypothetical protein
VLQQVAETLVLLVQGNVVEILIVGELLFVVEGFGLGAAELGLGFRWCFSCFLSWVVIKSR